MEKTVERVKIGEDTISLERHMQIVQRDCMIANAILAGYNETGLPKLDADGMSSLCGCLQPEQLEKWIREKVIEKESIPKHINRDKYLEMVEMPQNMEPLQAAMRRAAKTKNTMNAFSWCAPAFLIKSEGVEINPDYVEEVQESLSHYLEDPAKIEKYNAVNEICEKVNAFCKEYSIKPGEFEHKMILSRSILSDWAPNYHDLKK